MSTTADQQSAHSGFEMWPDKEKWHFFENFMDWSLGEQEKLM